MASETMDSAGYMSFDTTQRVLVPYTERLPKRLTYCIHMVVAVGMVGLNLLQIYLIKTLVNAKFEAMQAVIDRSSVWLGVVFLVVVSMFFAGCCLGVIFCLAPAAAGSGSPENKGWLNGTREMAGIFTWRNMFVRATATTFSNASGFPVGREGPTVTMGSNFAFCITEFVSRRYVKRRIKQMPEAQRAGVRGSDEEVTAIILEQERFIRAKRYACVVGGATGMAMIFDSPIGGIVYMFEEIGAMSWGADLTFSAFTATVTSDVLLRWLLDVLVDSDMKDWVIFQVDWEAYAFDELTWAWSDVPFFVAIAVLLGPFSALHTHLCLQVGTLRQNFFKRMQRQSLGKALDGVAFAAACALVATLVGLLGRCNELGDFNPEDADLELVRFTCGVGEYNPVASLLVTTSEAAMKLLITREEPDVGDYFFSVSDLLLAFSAYTLLNILLTGIPVPSGNFTGTMLIGGMVGRTAGNTVRHWHPGDDLAKPGVYAMMGSAAMLCGFKRMSMAVVLFIAECGDDWNLIPPLMVTVASSLILNQLLLKNGFDEEQMMRKKIPFLEPEANEGLSGHVAKEFIDEAVQTLPPSVAIDTLESFLQSGHAYEIPVVGHDNICIGFTTAARLRAALTTFVIARSSSQHASGEGMQQGALDDARVPIAACRVETDYAGLSLEDLVDASPYKVDEDMPAHRVYHLFAKVGINSACVVSTRGEFRGVITRANVSKVSLKLHSH